LGPTTKPPAVKPPPVHHAERPQREDHPQDHPPREGNWGRPSFAPSPPPQQMRPGGGGGSPTIGGTGF
jgi:hypothetical protein